ncbi:Os04g0449300 [Oryza sativa Japonica Group]|uniref:Os04g0449300 protein n=2 Tax=Oryza sativa subsp. japonica TaxID=39947 RepID=A0A0N7KJ51_ORYSJ|nr:hypothetical protein OsJ_14977 [Oryza sativa Japonica Group]KAB8095518.1 hypothetical protein EE612_023629 [Oryza sativa]BAF14844.1 Os04g0449300 [Oryza sativa Japonica Group]BAS89441.1 Os04g0449300 [Oryza sativa Japonica Group]|eukprot:NP_001052930.1 Os04g0449300 [Oryza sativa Japonica Group]
MEARLDGGGQPARRVRHLLVEGAHEHPRPQPGEPVADVPERRGGGRDHHVGEAQQHHLGERLLVVQLLAGALPVQVRRLEHAHGLPARRAVLVVQVLDPLGVGAVQRHHEHRLAPPRPRRRLRLVSGGGEVGPLLRHAGEDVLAVRARHDLAVELVGGDARPVEGAHLDADALVGAGHVRGVVPRHHPPHRVARVEQVAAEVVERGVAARQHPRQRALEPRDQEQPGHEVVVGEEHHPADAPQRVLPVVAEEARVVGVAVVVVPQVHVHPRRRRRRVVLGGALAAPQRVPEALAGARVEALHAGEREVPLRERPRGARERLAEEVPEAFAGGVVEEEDAVGEERIEESRREREHAVAEPLERRPHEVPALGVGGVRRRRGAEALHGALVGGGAGAAAAVDGLVASE